MTRLTTDYKHEPAPRQISRNLIEVTTISPARPRIFVSIASYRDTQAPLTVASLLKNADYPERVEIGLFNQIDPEQDQDCIVKDTRQVNQHIINCRESRGACWARGYVWSRLLGDQDFALQIDSHMRFAPGWDTCLLDMYYSLNDDKAVLSHYPMSFDAETETLTEQMYTRFDVQKFKDTGLPEISSAARPLAEAPARCLQTAFIAAGGLFTRAHVFREIPYDPFIYFHGEEITYAIRLWTHGYNLYLPNRPFMGHDYHNNGRRRLHWQEHDNWRDRNELATQRCRHLLRIARAQNASALQDLALFDLGFERTLTEYEQFSGRSFRHQSLSDKARKGEVQA